MKAVSYVIGYIMVFGLMLTILFTTTVIVYNRVETSQLSASEYLFDNIANQIVNAVAEAQKVYKAYPNAYFERKIELPKTHYEYTINVTDLAVYINSTKISMSREFGAYPRVHGIPVSGYVVCGHIDYIRVIYNDSKIVVKP